MGTTTERRMKRKAKRDAIRDLIAIGWADDEIALAVGVSDRWVRSIKADLDEVRARIDRMRSAREEIGGRLDLNAR